MNKVKVGFFSFTEITDPSEHRSYNEWHQLDHMPEQYPLAGVAWGQRWVSTPACRAARAVDEEPLSAAHYMTLYLMTDPVGTTLDAFARLGRVLSEQGRFHRHRRSCLSGPFDLLTTRVAPRVSISAEALPYRPNRGVYVIVEDPTDRGRMDAYKRKLDTEDDPGLVELAGVAGLWSFSGGVDAPGGPGRRITVCYLDGQPLEVAAAIAPVLERRWEAAPVRPLHAGPLETVVAWEWDWFG